jgi:hypothetical protein
MTIHLTGFKASTVIKPSRDTQIEIGDLKDTFQAICDIIPHDKDVPTYWCMNSYDPAGKHNKQSVRQLTGIILEYELRYAKDLIAALKDIPWHYLLVETERKSGPGISLFFPLAFEPDIGRYMRIAGVLAYQLGVYGLSHGSGTPTFLVKLAGGQQIAESAGPAISMSFIKETWDIGEASKTALDDFQGPKPVKQGASEFVVHADKFIIKANGKEQQIASHFRMLADLFDPE